MAVMAKTQLLGGSLCLKISCKKHSSSFVFLSECSGSQELPSTRIHKTQNLVGTVIRLSLSLSLLHETTSSLSLY